jgi:hypothetical protein
MGAAAPVTATGDGGGQRDGGPPIRPPPGRSDEGWNAVRASHFNAAKLAQGLWRRGLTSEVGIATS